MAMYDLIIVGGGPAGIAAAAVALNQRLETLITADRWGGQTTYAMQLEEVEGRETITGETLLDAFRRQLDYLDFVRHFDTVTKLMPEGRHFVVNAAEGNCFEGRTLIIAAGAKPQRLNTPRRSAFNRSRPELLSSDPRQPLFGQGRSRGGKGTVCPMGGC